MTDERHIKPTIRIWSQVDVRGEDECWPWTGSLEGSKRYGRTTFLGETKQAHVIIYEQVHGPVPEGYVVDHTCENKLCMNTFRHHEAVTMGVNTARSRERKKANA